nr:O-fucosyltransferase family protein [Tanacetum cinerariifolium]
MLLNLQVKVQQVRILIHGHTLDDGFVPLMAKKDVLTFLNYVPRFRKIEVHIEFGVSLVEKHMIEVMNQAKGVVTKEVVEDNVVKKVGKEGKVLLLEWSGSKEVGKERNAIKSSSQGSTSKVCKFIELSNHPKLLGMTDNNVGLPESDNEAPVSEF